MAHKNTEIAELAFKAATGGFGPSTYRLGGNGAAGEYQYNVNTWYNGAWRGDCLGFVHGMANPENLFSGDKNKVGGGATLNKFVNSSNEITTLNNYCTTKGGFPKADLKPGALLYKAGHVGLYIGEHTYNGKIYNEAECYWANAYNNGWGLRWIDVDTGKKYSYKGGALITSTWEKWGYFNHIDYTGSGSDLITSWQRAAKMDGATLSADGVWGSYSEKAAKNYTVKRGTKNKYLCSWLQEYLTGTKDYAGIVDGIAGEYTEAAIRKYQTRKNLTVDGWCGYYMWHDILGI